jgi:hypothetical protein
MISTSPQHIELGARLLSAAPVAAAKRLRMGAAVTSQNRNIECLPITLSSYPTAVLNSIWPMVSVCVGGITRSRPCRRVAHELTLHSPQVVEFQAGRGGRGVKSMRALDPLPHGVACTDFFSSAPCFDSINRNQRNQKANGCRGLRECLPRSASQIGYLFSVSSAGRYRPRKKCREIQGGGRGGWTPCGRLR